MRLSHLPLRAATGAFILNSGLNKRGMDGESAAGLHGMASGAIPQVKDWDPKTFAGTLSNTEIALGGALLLPFVSPVVAGAGLTAFGAGLMQLYRSTPGMTQEDGIRPTEAGTGLAKDVWLLATGLALLADGLIDGSKGAAKGAGKKVKKTKKKVAKSLPSR